MAAISLTKTWSSNLPSWSSNPPLRVRHVGNFEFFKYHLVAFRHLTTINAELICHTYEDGPIDGRAGLSSVVSRTESDTLHATFVLAASHGSCSYGERSIWGDEANGITIFIEISGLGESEACSYTKIKKVVHEYQAKRTLANEHAVDGPMREREIKNYVCSVFVYHWFVKDLDQMPDPSFGVIEAIARADVAEAQCYRALKLIVSFFREGQPGGLNLEKFKKEVTKQSWQPLEHTTGQV